MKREMNSRFENRRGEDGVEASERIRCDTILILLHLILIILVCFVRILLCS